jgi:hypothetical protein
MDVTSPQKYSWERIYPDSRPCRSFSVKLWECDKVEAPSRRNEDVKMRCEVVCPVEGFGEMPIHVNEKGVTFRKLQFDLEMIPLGGNLLDFVAYMNNRQIAREKIVIK